MPIAPGLLDQVAAQLAPLPELTIRRMFGGAGLYSAGLFFGVIDDDRVYLRAGDENRDDFKRAGSVAFQPVPDKPSMNYFSVPTAVLARGERFVEWALKAVAATRSAKAAKPKRAARKPAQSIKPSAVSKRAAPGKRKSIVASAPPTRAPAKRAVPATRRKR